MSNAARNEVLSSFGKTINNSLAETDRQKASKTPFNPIFQLLSLAMRTGRDRREVPPVSVETGTHFDERRRYRRVFVGENKMAAR